MPGGMGRNESAQRGFLRVLFFDDQGMGQEGQLCHWVVPLTLGIQKRFGHAYALLIKRLHRGKIRAGNGKARPCSATDPTSFSRFDLRQ